MRPNSGYTHLFAHILAMHQSIRGSNPRFKRHFGSHVGQRVLALEICAATLFYAIAALLSSLEHRLVELKLNTNTKEKCSFLNRVDFIEVFISRHCFGFRSHSFAKENTLARFVLFTEKDT